MKIIEYVPTSIAKELQVAYNEEELSSTVLLDCSSHFSWAIILKESKRTEISSTL